MAKILIVDDSPAMRNFLTGLLEDDHELIVGEDGIDAVWHFKTARPDAVLLDINMPIMTGLEALERVRILDPDARVAMLTGERDEAAIMSAIGSGAIDFVAKPYTRERVEEAIEALLSA